VRTLPAAGPSVCEDSEEASKTELIIYLQSDNDRLQ